MQTFELNIMLIEGNLSRIHGRDLFRYKAEVIRDEKGKFYYYVDNVKIGITPHEAKMVIRNPRLYYFSTALRLHFQVEREKKEPNYIRNLN